MNNVLFRGEGCGTAAGLVLLAFIAGPFTDLRAEDAPSLENSVLVLPLKVEQNLTASKKAYLGFALSNVLENMLSVHDGVQETWLNWHLSELFPKKSDLEHWLLSDQEIPTKARELDSRFILTGTIRSRGNDLFVHIALIDRTNNKRFEKELTWDLPGLREARIAVLGLLAEAGVTASETQMPKLLWKEDLSLDSLALLGIGIHHFLVASRYGSSHTLFDGGSFQRALIASPNSYVLFDNLAWVRLKQKQFSLASDLFQRAFEINAAGSDAIDGMVSVAVQQKDEKLGETWAQRKAEAQNKDVHTALADFWARLGITAYGQKDYQRAINDYRKAIELDPANIEYPTGLAEALIRYGNFIDARAVLQKALETDQGSDTQKKSVEELLAVTWSKEATSFFEQKTYDGAIRCLSEAVRLRPDDFEYVIRLALAYDHAGKFEEMGDLVEAAIKRFSRASEQKTLTELLSSAWGKRGETASERNDYPNAIEFFRKALAISPDGFRWIVELAVAYNLSNNREAAAQLLQDSLKRFPRHDDHVELVKLLALTYVGWSDQLTDQGRYADAMKLRKRAIAESREDPESEVATLNNLGVSLRELGDYAAAITYHMKALALCQARTKSNWTLREEREHETYMDLGTLYFTKKNYKKAREFYRRALEVDERAHNEGEINEARVGIADVSLKEGNIDEAIENFNNALVVAQAQKNRAVEAEILNTLGYAQYQKHDYIKATEYLSRGLVIHREENDLDSQAVGLANLMMTWKARGKPELAIFFGKLAVSVTQSYRRNTQQLEKRLQETYLRSVEDRYRELADLLVTLGRISEGEEVLKLLKEQEYRDFIRGGAIEAASTAVPLTQNEKDWKQRFNLIQDRVVGIGKEYSALVSKESLTEEETRRKKELEDDLAVNNKALDDLYNEISTRVSPKLSRDIKDSTRVLMANLSKVDPNAVVLETIVLDDKYRVIVTTPDVQVVGQYLIKREILRKKVFQFREAMRGRVPETEIKALARELYSILIEPIIKNIEDSQAKTLVWSLDDVLRYIPMAALYDGNQYLVQRFRNVVITEGSLLNLKEKPSASWTALGFGVSKAHQGFSELPNVPDELRGIIREEATGKIGGILPGRIMLDDNFTEKSFEDALRRRQYRVVHIASHFTINTDGNSEDSFLLLGEGKLSRLTMAQIAAIPDLFADVELLTLSACNTATSDYESSSSEKQGVEFESLGVLAQQEGAASVLASLWEVADASTSLLMKNFYQIREEQFGATKAEALQRAQLNLLLQSNGTYAEPFYWAPFVLIGNWR